MSYLGILNFVFVFLLSINILTNVNKVFIDLNSNFSLFFSIKCPAKNKNIKGKEWNLQTYNYKTNWVQDIEKFVQM